MPKEMIYLGSVALPDILNKGSERHDSIILDRKRVVVE